MNWTVLDDQSPTARKRHLCDSCGRWIEPGEKYRRIRYVGDDRAGVSKTCPQCNAVFVEIWHRDQDAFYEDEGIDLGEYLREHRAEPLLGLFRDRWRDTPVNELPLDCLPEED